MIAPVTRRFRIGRAESTRWIVIDTHLGRILSWFDSTNVTQKMSSHHNHEHNPRRLPDDPAGHGSDKSHQNASRLAVDRGYFFRITAPPGGLWRRMYGCPFLAGLLEYLRFSREQAKVALYPYEN